jgi:glycosyltransferase involved in cell wall biosynthesis
VPVDSGRRACLRHDFEGDRDLDRRLALTWQLTEVHGWGLVGVHTALYLTDRGTPPLLLEKPGLSTLRPENREKLAALEGPCLQAMQIAAQHPGQVLLLKGYDVLHALGNGFFAGEPSRFFRGERNVGVVAFEDTRIDEGVVGRANVYDKIIVHSTYNQRILQERGVARIGLAFQGVDPTEMGPRPRAGRFGDRFVVFSGGKMEFRKAQDTVLAAFRIFHQRHPDSVLATAWHNPWAHTAMSIAESPLTPVRPEIDGSGRLKITEWAAANGLPPEAFCDLGFMSRAQIAPTLAECDAAVFPNRCEGATNLVAMEAMACGVPTVLSANTGHLDIIRDGAGYVLSDQKPTVDRDGGRVDWKDSSIDELVEHLESIYTDRQTAKARADAARNFIVGERTWRAFAEAFVEACA